MYGLYILAVASFVWCAMTVYISYQLMETPKVSETDRNVAIATIVMSVVFCLTFILYVYLRQDQMDSTSRVVQGFRWYDAMILFCLLGWTSMALTSCSLLMTYTKTTSNNDRNVAIATIVISVVFLLQYIVYLFVQEQLPEWCTELRRRQEQEYQEIKSRREMLSDEDGPRKSAASVVPQIIVVPAGYPYPQQPKGSASKSL